MAILMDHEIRSRCVNPVNGKPMIEPFIDRPVRFVDGKKVISYGLSSAGYDVRIGDEFKIFTNINSTIVDPLNFNEDCLYDFKGDRCIIPPHSYALAVTVEYFRIPKNILTVCVGKSTYARSGIVINVTPIEPEFEGQVVIEIANTTPLPAVIYANQGISQFLFLEGDSDCELSYLDKAGKYQGQTGMTYAKG